MTKYTHGMRLDVYKSADGSDCSNNGVTSNVTEVILVGKDVPEIFEVKPEDTVLEIRTQPSGHVYALPVYDEADDRNGMWHMCGGNFVYSCDSRVGALTNDGGPIPVHDRIE